MPEPNFQGIGYDEDDIAGLLGGGGSQVDLSRIGNFLKKGATVGATGLLYLSLIHILLHHWSRWG